MEPAESPNTVGILVWGFIHMRAWVDIFKSESNHKLHVLPSYHIFHNIIYKNWPSTLLGYFLRQYLPIFFYVSQYDLYYFSWYCTCNVNCRPACISPIALRNMALKTWAYQHSRLHVDFWRQKWPYLNCILICLYPDWILLWAWGPSRVVTC